MIGFSTDQGPGLLEIQAVSASLADAALSDNVLQLRVIATNLRADVRRIERDLADHRRVLRSLPAMVAGASDQEVDLAVGELLRQERRLLKAWQMTTRLSRKLEAKATQFRPATYSLVRQITSTADSWYRPYLQFLRDARWELMALAAERAPPADGPTLADASDVDAYFRSMPPAA
jgi:hypothetical protein